MITRRHFVGGLAAAAAAGVTFPRSLFAQDQAARSDRWGDILPTRPLGRYEDERITLAGLGGQHYRQLDPSLYESAIEAAMAGGVRFYDTATNYGRDQLSEKLYGTHLTPKYRDEIFLMTKSASRNAEGAKRDAAMIADLDARGGTPVPTDICQLGAGIWCSDSPHAGELSVQGVVEANGQRGRFDQVVGQGWVLLGFESDPAAALTKAQQAQFAQIDGLTIQLGGGESACDVVDAEGTFKAWFKDIDAKYVLIRPDFYVALTAGTTADLQHRFDTVIDALHLSAQPVLAAE